MKTGKESRQNRGLFSCGRVATTVRMGRYGGADLSVRQWKRVHTVPGKASHLRFCVNRMKIPTHSDGRILKYVFNFSLEEMKLSKYASAENAQSGNYDRENRRMASVCQFASSLTARTGSAYACPEQVKGSTTLTSPPEHHRMPAGGRIGRRSGCRARLMVAIGIARCPVISELGIVDDLSVHIGPHALCRQEDRAGLRLVAVEAEAFLRVVPRAVGIGHDGRSLLQDRTAGECRDGRHMEARGTPLRPSRTSRG